MFATLCNHLPSADPLGNDDADGFLYFRTEMNALYTTKLDRGYAHSQFIFVYYDFNNNNNNNLTNLRSTLSARKNRTLQDS